jgi:hypothetical protein
VACCTETQLCERCHGRELASKVGQARVIGETWAEQVCCGEHRQREAWPELEPKTLAIARRLVGALAQDRARRLIDRNCCDPASLPRGPCRQARAAP